MFYANFDRNLSVWFHFFSTKGMDKIQALKET